MKTNNKTNASANKVNNASNASKIKVSIAGLQVTKKEIKENLGKKNFVELQAQIKANNNNAKEFFKEVTSLRGIINAIATLDTEEAKIYREFFGLKKNASSNEKTALFDHIVNNMLPEKAIKIYRTIDEEGNVIKEVEGKFVPVYLGKSKGVDVIKECKNMKKVLENITNFHIEKINPNLDINQKRADVVNYLHKCREKMQKILSDKLNSDIPIEKKDAAKIEYYNKLDMLIKYSKNAPKKLQAKIYEPIIEIIKQ